MPYQVLSVIRGEDFGSLRRRVWVVVSLALLLDYQFANRHETAYG